MDLQEMQERFDAVTAEIRQIFDQAKSTAEGGSAKYDYRKVSCVKEAEGLEGSAKSLRVAEHVGSLNAELNDLGEKIDSHKQADAALDEFETRENTPKGALHDGKPAGGEKTLGDLITSHKSYQRLIASGGSGKVEFELPKATIPIGRKTTFETTAGWAPETTRTGMVVPAVVRPPQLIDIMPTIPTTQSAVVYMEETTRTSNAAEIAEGGAYPEDAYALTERTSTVRKIGTHIPVTDEQLADVPMARAYLDDRLPSGVRLRLDGQLLNGNGIAPNLEGILNNGSIQTQAKGADTELDAIYKAMDNVRVTGRAAPTHVAMHSTDWQAIRLQKTADGVYIYGSPADAGVERVWGLPLVKNEALTVTNALVGSFEMSWIHLAERAGIVIEVGYVNDDFTDGRRTIRAQGRWALVVTRPAAFCEVTGL